MTMPVNLILLRHGESEGNLANDLSKNGDDSMFDDAFRSRYSASWNLTPKGVEQAKAAGLWIKKNIGPYFDRYYVAEYHRAMQTAAYADFENADWRLEFLLRERDWGQLDVATRSERVTASMPKSLSVESGMAFFGLRPEANLWRIFVCALIGLFKLCIENVLTKTY